LQTKGNGNNGVNNRNLEKIEKMAAIAEHRNKEMLLAIENVVVMAKETITIIESRLTQATNSLTEACNRWEVYLEKKDNIEPLVQETQETETETVQYGEKFISEESESTKHVITKMKNTIPRSLEGHNKIMNNFYKSHIGRI
jgi:hypothetical protein